MITESRNNNFNIIRFVAAMMVVLGHMSHLIAVEVNQILGQAISTIGVKIFFLISGYLIAQSFLNDSNMIRYFVRRFFRIIPGLAGVVFFAIFIVGPFFTILPLKDYFSHGTTWSYLKNIVLNIQYFLPGVFETNPYPNAINGSLWTLPVEVMMYIALPVVFLIFSKKNKIVAAIIFAIILESINMGLSKFLPDARLVVYGTDMVSALTIIPYFFVGIIFISPKIKKYLNLQLAIGFFCIAEMMNFSSTKSEIVVFCVLPYFVFSFAFVENPKFVKCFSKNDYSYGLYLYGFLIQQVVVKLLWNYQLSLNVYFSICAVVTTFVGILSWYLIERPAQRLAKKLLKSDKIARMKKFDISPIE